MPPPADAVQRVIQTALVVQQVKASIEITAVVVFPVDLRDEYEFRIFGLNCLDEAAELSRIHELHHVASEPVHSA